ncbi:cyclase [Actinokineospora diospyrosa]|uniref:Dehydratase n=1 Tax=Actinokineospora diospyrosa TaxID=103728 RepID=A0ABT1IAV5_9PSEU|nr:cyclase [Actinokineospora diospyrosa]MCP2269769.1 dehydratase [Actinokineospora diospyrosa]
MKRALSVVALVALPLVALAPPASAVPVTVNYACQATALGSTYPATLTQPLDVSTPASVASGGSLSVVYDPQTATLPSTVGSFTLVAVQNLTFKVPVPANSTYVSSSLSGGSGVGTPTLTVSGGVATLATTGSIPGGGTFELPTITLNLTAGAPGTIQTTLYGTSFANPGLTATGVVRVPLLGNVNVPASCYPSPNPAITTTTVV